MGVWKMATSPKTRVELPPSFYYLLEKISKHAEEIQQLIDSVEFREARLTYYKMKLEFAGIKNCCDIAEDLLDEIRYIGE